MNSETNLVLGVVPVLYPDRRNCCFYDTSMIKAAWYDLTQRKSPHGHSCTFIFQPYFWKILSIKFLSFGEQSILDSSEWWVGTKKGWNEKSLKEAYEYDIESILKA